MYGYVDNIFFMFGNTLNMSFRKVNHYKTLKDILRYHLPCIRIEKTTSMY